MSSNTYRPAPWTDPRAAVRASSIHGTGMFAKEPIFEGEIVAICGGTVMTTDQFQAYIATVTYYSAIQIGEDAHLVELSDQKISETGSGGMNHSCDANLWMRDEVTVVARRAIAADEELTQDYAFYTTSSRWIMHPCCCGSPVCRRTITGNDWQLKEVQQRYQGHLSPFLNERIRRLSQN